MIDLHTHTLLSDGVLLPSELIQRAKIKGYKTIGITDHVDDSNIEYVVKRICELAEKINMIGEIYVIPGVEITHVPPVLIFDMVAKARKLGAKLVVVHGETIAEPVATGTNFAALKSDIDILAHPGLITHEEVMLAKQKNIFLEITTRRGHAFANGHLFRMASDAGARLIINSDSHEPQDILIKEWVEKVAMGAGMNKNDILITEKNANDLCEKIRNK